MHVLNDLIEIGALDVSEWNVLVQRLSKVSDTYTEVYHLHVS